jgi:hypothetical protein
MKTGIINKRRIQIFQNLAVTFLLLFSMNCHAQKSKEISLTLYPGYTIVNFADALGYSDEYMEDWDQFHYSAALRGFLGSSKSIQFGAEAAWQRLYYAYYIVPYGPSPVYREFNVTSVSIMALVRYSPEMKFFATGGAGIHIFNNGVAPALCIEGGYMLKVGEKLRIPVSVRINPIFGDGLPIPISAGVGIAYLLR